MQPELIYKVSGKELHEALADTLKETVEEKIYNRFYSVFIDCKTLAKIHNLSPRTVTRYIQDGTLITEPGTKLFRLSYALKLDLTLIKYKRK